MTLATNPISNTAIDRGEVCNTFQVIDFSRRPSTTFFTHAFRGLDLLNTLDFTFFCSFNASLLLLKLSLQLHDKLALLFDVCVGCDKLLSCLLQFFAITAVQLIVSLLQLLAFSLKPLVLLDHRRKYSFEQLFLLR